MRIASLWDSDRLTRMGDVNPDCATLAFVQSGSTLKCNVDPALIARAAVIAGSTTSPGARPTPGDGAQP